MLCSGGEEEVNMFCDKCGKFQSIDVKFCADCGAEIIAPKQAAILEQAKPNNHFLEILYKHGAGTMFLIGCILYTIGSIVSIFLTSLSVINVISIPLVVLPVIGVWLMYITSVKKISSNGVLWALTLFKIPAVITLVAFCILLGLTAIGMLFSLFNSFGAFLIFGIGGGIFFLLVKFYSLALLKIIKSIRNCIVYNPTREIISVGTFVVISCIMIGFDVVLNLIGLFASPAINTVTQNATELAGGFGEIASDAIPFIGVHGLGALLRIASAIGMLLLIIALRKFSKDVYDNITVWYAK